ncbi:hypothetical protein ACROYT_G033786 [Oculina patagonica]
MANISLGEVNYTSQMNQTSTEPWLIGVLVYIGVYLFLSVLNILLSITAILGNVVILLALQKETSLHPPTKLLFRCLAVTDLCAGLISQPLFAVAVVEQIIDISYKDEGYIVTAFTLCGMSILTSTAISVDRLLALLLGLRYRHVVTLRRTRAVIVSFFVISVPCGSMHFWSTSITWVSNIFILVLCLATATFSYTKIYLTLRQHQSQVQNHLHPGRPNIVGPPPNIARYKRTVSSIAWVQLALVACYTPYVIVSFLRFDMFQGKLISVLYFATVTLIYFNSSLNPILYCWKIKEVKQAVKDTIRQLCCCCS